MADYYLPRTVRGTAVYGTRGTAQLTTEGTGKGTKALIKGICEMAGAIAAEDEVLTESYQSLVATLIVSTTTSTVGAGRLALSLSNVLRRCFGQAGVIGARRRIITREPSKPVTLLSSPMTAVYNSNLLGAITTSTVPTTDEASDESSTKRLFSVVIYSKDGTTNTGRDRFHISTHTEALVKAARKHYGTTFTFSNDSRQWRVRRDAEVEMEYSGTIVGRVRLDGRIKTVVKPVIIVVCDETRTRRYQTRQRYPLTRYPEVTSQYVTSTSTSTAHG